ncbi:MAG: RHS repeat-associated core domain-containing protein [Puniceicoccaceae bacterium]
MIAVSRAFDPKDDLLSFNPTASPRLRAIPPLSPRNTPSLAHFNSRGDVIGRTGFDGIPTYLAAYEASLTRRSTPIAEDIAKAVGQHGTTNTSTEWGANPDRQQANTKEEDPTGLLNEGFRYRDLKTGTFLSRDPLGFVDGPNLYAYVVQNPWTRFDPLGLMGTVETVVANQRFGAEALRREKLRIRRELCVEDGQRNEQIEKNVVRIQELNSEINAFSVSESAKAVSEGIETAMAAYRISRKVVYEFVDEFVMEPTWAFHDGMVNAIPTKETTPFEWIGLFDIEARPELESSQLSGSWTRDALLLVGGGPLGMISRGTKTPFTLGERTFFGILGAPSWVTLISGKPYGMIMDLVGTWTSRVSTFEITFLSDEKD